MIRLRWPARRWAVILAALAVPGTLGGCAAGSASAASGGDGHAAAASCATAARGKWTAVEPASPGSSKDRLGPVLDNIQPHTAAS